MQKSSPRFSATRGMLLCHVSSWSIVISTIFYILSLVPVTKEYRRYPLHETQDQKAIKQAVGQARIRKRATPLHAPGRNPALRAALDFRLKHPRITGWC